MRRATTTGMLLASAAALVGLTAPAYANSPAVHSVEDVTGDTLVCESTTYTITSGSLRIVIHEGAAASGNENVTGTLTLQNVVAEDSVGNVYSLRGAFWFGGSFNAHQGAGVFTDTGKLQVISKGSGTVDSVNVTSHVTEVNGHVIDFDFGTCEEPE
jgi:hypothetical protein